MIGIYGANGFIGRNLLNRLMSERAAVRAVSRHFDIDLAQSRKKGVELVDADFRDPLAMVSSLEGVETVVQLISTSSPGMQNKHNVSDIRDNVIPHVDFLQNAINAGVKRYIFLSSGGTVYGPTSEKPIREDAATNPISSHGLTKLTIEKYIQMHGMVDDLDYVILRLSNPFGPGQAYKKGQGLIPAVLARHASGQPIRIIGNGSAKRDFIFIEDVVDAIKAAIEQTKVRQAILNIGSGEARSVLEVIDTMEEVLGTRFERDFVETRRTDVDVNVLDVTRARDLLGWQPETSFREGLERTLQGSSDAQ